MNPAPQTHIAGIFLRGREHHILAEKSCSRLRVHRLSLDQEAGVPVAPVDSRVLRGSDRKGITIAARASQGRCRSRSGDGQNVSLFCDGGAAAAADDRKLGRGDLLKVETVSADVTFLVRARGMGGSGV